MRIKGIDEYLEAAKIIKKKYPYTNFYIAGFVEDDEYKEKIASYQDYVIPLGFVKDITSEIKKCHCTVLPSYGGEGVPNVLLESSAMGRICIGSRIPGICDVIDEGVTGYLFEPKSIQSLAEAMEKVLILNDDERLGMCVAARRKVERCFDRGIVIRKYMDEIYQLRASN